MVQAGRISIVDKGLKNEQISEEVLDAFAEGVVAHFLFRQPRSQPRIVFFEQT